ncbi:hypothetical protein MGA3_03160 [Bacillus methanolicus MGA3]|nr:hypothetical protein MGA3_03160 [Bacillus methanolicus MGA3]
MGRKVKFTSGVGIGTISERNVKMHRRMPLSE